MKINSRFTFDKVKYDQENDVHLVVSLEAPKVDWQSKRPPICLNLVLDRSGSMGGDKLPYVKRSVEKLLEHLQPGDYCGITVFDSDVSVLAGPVEMTQYQKDAFRTKVNALNVGSSTNMSGGLLQGLELANKADLPRDLINRVILLTDGQANVGVATKSEQLLALLDANLGNASLSAFGYGADCDQDLLASLARKGKGNYAYIENPDKALTSFAKELGGLLSTYAQNVNVLVSPHNGHRITEVISDVDVEEVGNDVKIKLPDILGEEQRHLVLAMKLSAQSQALPRAMNVVDVKVTYDLLDTLGKKTSKTEELKAKIQFVKPGEEQTKADMDVDKLVGVAQLIKGQIEAEEKAKHGNYEGAAATMDFLAVDYERRGLGMQVNAAREGRKRLASAQAYGQNSREGYFTSLRSAGTRGGMSSGSNAQAEGVMAAMGLNTCGTSSQQEAVASFVGQAPPAQVGGVWVGGGAVAGAGISAAPAGLGIGGVVSIGGPPPVEAKPASPPPKKTLSKKRSKRW